MARPLRMEYEGAPCHVMNRGAGRRRIFREVSERRLFLDPPGELDESFGVESQACRQVGRAPAERRHRTPSDGRPDAKRPLCMGSNDPLCNFALSD